MKSRVFNSVLYTYIESITVPRRRPFKFFIITLCACVIKGMLDVEHSNIVSLFPRRTDHRSSASFEIRKDKFFPYFLAFYP